MAYKTFVVERTEDAQTGTAGPATLHRNNVPQLMKVYDTVADAEADIANIDTNEIVGTKEVDLSSYMIVNRVADGNLNPVTSNAVAAYIADQLELSDFEYPNLSSITTMQYDGQIRVSAVGGEKTITIVRNSTSVVIGCSPSSSIDGTGTFDFMKGDKITVSNWYNNCACVQYYKKRDYSLR
jgi:uncharacterized protein (UPF0264 family)